MNALAMITHVTAWSIAPIPSPKAQPAPSPMPTIVNMLLPLRTPRALIVGLVLTNDQAQGLLASTKSAQALLRQQLSAIYAMGMRDTESTHYLRSIQERQALLQNILKRLITSTKPSTSLWLHEIEDLHHAALRKLTRCNRESPSNHMGWKDAAAKYWPLIAESYEVLVPIVVRFICELEAAVKDEGLRASASSGGMLSGLFRSTPDSTASPTATFSKYAKVRRISSDAEVPVKDSIVALTSDRKRTDLTKLRKIGLPAKEDKWIEADV